MRIFAAAAFALALAGCATPGGNFHQISQRAESGAEVLYVATVKSLDGLEASHAIDHQTHDNDWRLAWSALQDARTQYNLGFTVNLAVLQARAKAAGVPKAVIDKAGAP